MKCSGLSRHFDIDKIKLTVLKLNVARGKSAYPRHSLIEGFWKVKTEDLYDF